MTDIIISTSILSADFSNLGCQIQEAEKGGADWLHIDVMDGHFVPNISMGPFIVEHCRKISNLPLDVHLMIENPDQYIESFANAGADKLSVHIENNANIYRTLQRIRELGCSPAIVLNPGTPASSLDTVFHLVDMVLVMTVNPGFSGQKFTHAMGPKITQIRQTILAQNTATMIQVDGGINKETLPLARKAGAEVFVAATAIFKHPHGIKQGIQELREAALQTEA